MSVYQAAEVIAVVDELNEGRPALVVVRRSSVPTSMVGPHLLKGGGYGVCLHCKQAGKTHESEGLEESELLLGKSHGAVSLFGYSRCAVVGSL
jgi:hypothetical protein